MNANKILLVLIFISFFILGFALKNRADYITELRKKQEIENNISSASTVRDESKIENSSNNISSNTYTIKKGDTLWDIAEKKYGSGFMYHKIIEKNPGKTFKFAEGREGLIYEGTVLDL